MEQVTVGVERRKEALLLTEKRKATATMMRVTITAPETDTKVAIQKVTTIGMRDTLNDIIKLVINPFFSFVIDGQYNMNSTNHLHDAF